MDEVQKYWRDSVTGIIKWAVAVYTLVAGWSLSNHQLFELFADPNGKLSSDEIFDNWLRGIVLIVGSVIFGVALPATVAIIYRKFLLEEKIDATVVPMWLSITVSSVISLLLISVAIATAVL